MSEITLSQLADDIGISIKLLQQQIEEAGLPIRAQDEMITDEEKSRLLDYLRVRHGKTSSENKRITLRRRTSSEIRVPQSVQGRGKARTKTVNVEVRRKRTYVRRSALETMAKLEEASAATEQPAQGLVVNHDASATDQNLSVVDGGNVKQHVPNNVQNWQDPAPKKDAEGTSPTSESDVTAEKDETMTNASQKSEGQDKEQSKTTRHGRRELRIASEKSGRRRKKTRQRAKIIPTIETQHVFEKPTEPVVKEVELSESISVGDLAQKMSVKANEVIKLMMGLGSMVTINQILDQDTAALVVEEMGHKAKLISERALTEELALTSHEDGEQHKRAPVVTVMGHVDHGKTSLLDYIRKSKVSADEAGGITQHIGAYVVEKNNNKITFLDTPGHAAFTAMRTRGANVTDIVVIVVAADDGVMPQTQEAVQHAKAASTPIIVAVNKIDKKEADPERVKQEMSKIEVVPEDWGGDVQFVDVSAHTGAGIDELLESILLQAELLELKARTAGPATGTVIEARLDKGRGPIATVLVQNGALNKGDIILSGKEFGRARAIMDSNGKEITTSVGPSTPVEIFGLSGIPDAGDELFVAPDERKAREIAEFRRNKDRESKLSQQRAIKLHNAMEQMSEGDIVTLHLLVKADVQGSAEAIVDALDRLPADEVKVNVVSSGVGGITETDLNLALTSKATVIGFNVRADAAARKVAGEEGIEIRYYSIIYELIDDIKAAMSGMLAPELRERIIGVAEVKDVFRSPKFGDIAGCIVTSGLIKKDSPIRVLREDVVIYEGTLESLRRFKDDVNEVKSGTECGIGVKNYDNVKPGDQIEVFERVEVARTI